MQGQETVQRCLKLVEELSQSQGWSLTVEQRARYAERVAALTRGREAGEGTLATMLSYYHTEHRLVEALADRESPDHAAAWQLLRQILARHPDQRLATIMQLWAVEERSLREIGAQLQLSVGRVHGLLAQAQAMLQTNPSLLAWVDRPPIDADGTGEPAVPPGLSQNRH